VYSASKAVQLARHTRVTSPDFRGDFARPESWLARRGETLRTLEGRRVFRAEIAGQRVVVKEYTRRRLRDWLRPHAETEADNALAVAARGVPVVEPLAWAQLGDGRQILVLREEEGAVSLHELFLRHRPTGRKRHALCRNVGELIARMQNAGIRHRDPHAGNILVRPDFSVLLADAWDLRPGDYLTAAERAATIAGFAPFFLTHGNVVDLLMFWGAYGRASEFSPEQLEELRELVLRRVPVAFRKLVGRRTRRTRRLGRAVKFGAFSGVLTGDVDPAIVERTVARAEHLGRGPDVIKASPTAWTLRIGDDFVAKVFLPKKVSRPLRDLVLGTRAERALEAAEACFHRGVRTPEVVAVLRDGLLPSRSILLMRRVTDAQPIEDVFAGAGVRRAREIAVRVGKTLRRMNDWGLRHRDLKKDNVFYDAERDEVVLLDLDGIRQTRSDRVDWPRRARDLANLAGSLLDRNRVPLGLRLRALDSYLAGTNPPGYGPGGFARLVLRLSEETRERRLQ